MNRKRPALNGSEEFNNSENVDSNVDQSREKGGESLEEVSIPNRTDTSQPSSSYYNERNEKEMEVSPKDQSKKRTSSPVDLEAGKDDVKVRQLKEDHHRHRNDEPRKFMDKIDRLLNVARKKDRSGSDKQRVSAQEKSNQSAYRRPSKRIMRRDIGELIRYLFKRHITLLFWVRFGARLCMALLYIAMAKCEHDLVATVFNQQGNVCIKHYENVKPVESLLTFATFPVIPDFFMGALGILPLYRLYNDPFVFGYNLIMAVFCIWTGISVRAQVVDCGEMVTNIVIYSANILICMGFVHFVPFFITFLMIRKGEELFLINRFLYFFKKPPEEGYWWSLPRQTPVQFVNIAFVDEKTKSESITSEANTLQL